MSLARIATFAFAGIQAVPVEVQVQLAPGLPAFLVVGLADKAVAESRERVRAALTGLGLALPAKRVLVNMAPADLAKEGSHYDLPIALALLAAMEVIPRDELACFAALGELSLDGSILPVAGVLPAALGASARSLGLICPAAQGGEAAWAGRGEVLAPTDLPMLLNHFRGVQVMTPPAPPPLHREEWRGPCLSEVKGQETAKRALEIAAAGGHNLLPLMTRDPVAEVAPLPFGASWPTEEALSDVHGWVVRTCCGCGDCVRLSPSVLRGRGTHRPRPLLDVLGACHQCGSVNAYVEIGAPGWHSSPVRLPLAAPVLVPCMAADRDAAGPPARIGTGGPASGASVGMRSGDGAAAGPSGVLGGEN